MITGWIGICLGVLFGYFGRAMIYKQHLQFPGYWRVAFPLLTFSLILFVRHMRKRNRNRVEKLDPRRRRSISYSAQDSTDLLHAPWLATGKQISRGFQGGVPPWSQGAGSCPAREGELTRPALETSNLFSQESISQELIAEGEPNTSFPRDPDDDHSGGIPLHMEDGVGFEQEREEQPNRLPTREMGIPYDPSRPIHAEWDVEHGPRANQRDVIPALASCLPAERKEGKDTLFSMEIMDFLRRLRMPRKSLTNLWLTFILKGICTTLGVLPLLS
jgi:hypothetical protein